MRTEVDLANRAAFWRAGLSLDGTSVSINLTEVRLITNIVMSDLESTLKDSSQYWFVNNKRIVQKVWSEVVLKGYAQLISYLLSIFLWTTSVWRKKNYKLKAKTSVIFLQLFMCILLFKTHCFHIFYITPLSLQNYYYSPFGRKCSKLHQKSYNSFKKSWNFI